MLSNISIKGCLFATGLLAGALLLTPPLVTAQTVDTDEVAKVTTATGKAAESTDPQPVLTEYRGIRIGMAAEDVRNKLGHLREKGKVQDFFVFSDNESAQVFYDSNGNVRAISVDYMGMSNPPTPKDVLGEDLQAKPDGSMYGLTRYPSAGFWVAYSRTGGDDPIVTITIQKSSL
jgi:hypothetical protein